MKNKMIKILGLGIVLAGLSTGVNAQATATATAAGTIISPISIVKDVNLNFGNMSSDGTVGTVVLSAAASPTRLASGGLTAVAATPGTVTAAKFTVTGNNGFTYLITVPTAPVSLVGTTAGVTATSFTTDKASNIGSISTGTTDVFYVGATFNAPVLIAAGTYTSGNFNVTVNYN
jgi:hypothetical protein